ncbi:MAG TPA: peptide ABC transporter permease, partial [Deltaproteobacteria bacterium]|nr:peptide ABC transporter permease [Deltaproteobacteria bacterium]
MRSPSGAWGTLLRHRIALAGMVLIGALVCMAAFAPLLAPCDPNEQDLYHVLEGPSKSHLLGTDDVGRDLLSRVIYGSRVTLAMGAASTIFSATIG